MNDGVVVKIRASVPEFKDGDGGGGGEPDTPTGRACLTCRYRYRTGYPQPPQRWRCTYAGGDLCSYERCDKGMCGAEGHFWEQYTPPPKPDKGLTWERFKAWCNERY